MLQLLYSNMQEEEISGDDLEGLIAVGHLSEGWADSTRESRASPFVSPSLSLWLRPHASGLAAWSLGSRQLAGNTWHC